MCETSNIVATDLNTAYFFFNNILIEAVHFEIVINRLLDFCIGNSMKILTFCLFSVLYPVGTALHHLAILATDPSVILTALLKIQKTAQYIFRIVPNGLSCIIRVSICSPLFLQLHLDKFLRCNNTEIKSIRQDIVDDLYCPSALLGWRKDFLFGKGICNLPQAASF